MYLISISFDENKAPNHFRDIHNQQCLKYYIDSSGFLIVTDKNEILHYYKIDYIVAFHIEYLGEYVE